MTWKESTQYERNLRIWQEEFEDFVPERVLDMHVHIFDDATIPAGDTYSCGGHPIRSYTFDEFDADLADLYPGRHTEALCFGTPHREYDMAANNAYVARAADRERFFPLRLFDPNEPDHEAVRRDLIENRHLGIKPYLNYVVKDDPNDVEIHEMVPPWIMEIVDDLGLMVMLHIPRKKRLADPINQRQIVELCERHPNARIILAHVGRAYYLRNVVGYLDALKDIPNLWFDLAMLNSWEVLEYLFATVPHEKILYATDTPIALAPGKSVEINDQYTYVTPVPWHLSISDEHRKLVFTSFLYEELRAIKKAAERLALGGEFLEGLFYDNGRALIDAVAPTSHRADR